jgi:S1-C subfamily serine protease
MGAHAEDMPTLAPLIDKVAPGVVKIEITGRTEQQPPPADVLLSLRPVPSGDSAAPRSAGARNPASRRKSAESGVIFDANDGLIVVNHHVIADASRIVVSLNDGRRLRATPVGTDPDTDVALIRVPAENLAAVPFGDSDKVSVGDYAISIGYPFDVGQTVTLGIVSALHRSDLGLGPYEDFIQTDAPANPGDSGGAPPGRTHRAKHGCVWQWPEHRHRLCNSGERGSRGGRADRETWRGPTPQPGHRGRRPLA